MSSKYINILIQLTIVVYISIKEHIANGDCFKPKLNKTVSFINIYFITQLSLTDYGPRHQIQDFEIFLVVRV